MSRRIGVNEFMQYDFVPPHAAGATAWPAPGTPPGPPPGSNIGSSTTIRHIGRSSNETITHHVHEVVTNFVPPLGASATALPAQSRAASRSPPPRRVTSATALPAQSRAASRSPPPRRETRAPCPAPNGGRVTRGFAATPQSDQRYLLVDVRLGDLLRQMSPTQGMNLFINALWRHEHAESGIIGQTDLSIDESSTTIYWNLEVMGGRPRGRVADLHVVEWSFETP